MLDDTLASDLWRLARLFQRICASKRRHVDFADEELRRALREVIVCLPVYRTYLHPSAPERPADVGLVRAAVAAAREQSQDLDFELLGFLEELLSGHCLSELEWELVSRFQQLSAAATAKGVEDTAFYRYARLLALNDVGGDPGRFGISVERFHAANRERAERFPHNLLVTQTHDTKRSGDVRARIGALSTMPGAWAAHVRRWLELTRDLTGPDDVERYFVFQTLARRKPDVDGGVYGYARAGFGEYVGFTSAWGYWVSAWVGNVAYLVLLMATLGYWFGGFEGGTTVPAVIGASVLLWVVHALTP